jgi:type VI secretion system secreted protein Hcp
MAQADYFLKIDGVDGESSDDKHKGEIEIDSWSMGAQQASASGAGGGGGVGKVHFHDFHITKSVDKSSAKLFLACATGEHFKTAELTCRKAGKDQQEYLKLKFTEVIVTSIQQSGKGNGEVGEMVTLGFAKFEKEYKEQKPDGTLGGAVKAGWDLKVHKKV